MSARAKFAVHFFNEGDGFVVRGTLDPHMALALAVAEDEFDDRYDHLLIAARPRPGISDPEPTPETIADLAEVLHEWLSRAKPGLYRFTPANAAERDDYISWWLKPVNTPGRGVWRGVWFS